MEKEKGFKSFLNKPRIKIKVWWKEAKTSLKDCDMFLLKKKYVKSKYMSSTLLGAYFLVLIAFLEPYVASGGTSVSFFAGITFVIVTLFLISEVHYRSQIGIYIKMKENEEFNRSMYKTIMELYGEIKNEKGYDDSRIECQNRTGNGNRVSGSNQPEGKEITDGISDVRGHKNHLKRDRGTETVQG